MQRVLLLCAALLAVPAQAQDVSSVAPLRMSDPPSVTAIFPGHFQSGRRAGAVVIHDESASLCHGPDYRRCVPLGHLPARRTVATTIKGETKLLVLDTMASARVCSISGNSLDCRAVDQNRLADYNVSTLADGKVLQVEGTDGTYFCTAASGQTNCHQITTADGAPMKLLSEKDQQQHRQQGAPFKPLDQPDKTCRVKKGEIRCGNDKFSELGDDFLFPLMMPVLILEDNGQQGDWTRLALDRVTVTGRYVDTSAPMYAGFWQGQSTYGGYVGNGPHLLPSELPPKPPTYYRDQCNAICDQQDRDYRNLCATSAGFAFVVFGPVIGGGYLVACDAGRGWNDYQCRHICMS